MKQTILFTLFTLLMFSTSVAAREIDLSKIPSTPGPRPLSLVYIPVTATIDESELAVYFDMNVGNAIITVYDDMHQTVSQQAVVTSSTTEVNISSSNWTIGNYTLTITYGTTTISGEFVME
jgi:Protein of unknown function (DUF3244).